MARATTHLVETLRKTAHELESGAEYNWGNATKCNCAHLAKALAPEIATRALVEIRPQLDEWTEFANDYCPHSGAPADKLLDTLYANGLGQKDIHQLEYLSNKEVLNALPGGFRYLEHGNRRDVALYLRTWASLLELELKTNKPVKQQPQRAVAEASEV